MFIWFKLLLLDVLKVVTTEIFAVTTKLTGFFSLYIIENGFILRFMLRVAIIPKLLFLFLDVQISIGHSRLGIYNFYSLSRRAAKSISF